MVGKGLECPEIIRKLLNVEEQHQKPQYLMAPEQPLLLYSCDYDNLCFNRSQGVFNRVFNGISSEIIRYEWITARL